MGMRGAEPVVAGAEKNSTTASSTAQQAADLELPVTPATAAISSPAAALLHRHPPFFFGDYAKDLRIFADRGRMS